MQFKNWLEMSSLRDLLKDVPQGKFHPEGPVFKHVRLVRRALDPAIKIFSQEPIFKIYPPVSEADRKVLRLGAWLHDIGKASATTWKSDFGEVLPWKDVQHPETGRWTSVGHEDPEYYEPMLKSLGTPWQKMHQGASEEDRDLVKALIEKHMGYVGDSFSRGFFHTVMDDYGRIRGDRKSKLLIIFKMMDILGREGVSGNEISGFIDGIRKESARRRAFADKEAEKRLPITPEDFIKKLREKGLSATQINNAVKGKFR